MPTDVQMLYGRDGISLSLPRQAAVLAGEPIAALPRPIETLRSTLDDPIGTAPLAELLSERRPKSLAVTISDITRPIPNELILSVLLDVFASAGIADQQVTIIVGTGMHRPSTDAEKVEMLGEEIVRRCEVIDHRADDPDTLVRIADDPPVSVCRRFAEADFRIVTGLIEPHFMAGFSGGRKGICPALVDLATVQRFHGYRILADPLATTGQIDENPCHAESLRVARLVGCDFLVNVAITRHREPAEFYVGEMQAAHEVGCREVARMNTVAIDRPFDLVVTGGGGYPLDQTYYQNVKGMVTAMPALHERSVLLIAGHCGEGIGSESYERIMMRFAQDTKGFLRHIEQTMTVEKDQWQLQMQARVAAKIGAQRMYFATDVLDAETLTRLGVCPLPGEGDAAARTQAFLDAFAQEHPDASIAVIPEGPYAMLRGI